MLCNVLVLFSVDVSAQTKKFKWETELCEFEGTYDSTKYTEAQIKNTQMLVSSAGHIPLETDATVWKFEDIEKLDVEALDKEYKTKHAELKNLDIVKTEFFENLRQSKLKEMEQVYKLSKATMLGYKNPVALKEYTPAEACIIKYANPLIAGGDSLLEIWREVNLASQSRNASPEHLRQRFDKQSNSPDKLKYAQVEVMNFGWWNCANETIEYAEYDDKNQENFDKLFIKM